MMSRKPQPAAEAPTAWQQVAPYATLSLACFLCGVGLLLLMLRHAERLHALGLVGQLYYLVLLPLSLAVAGFLFGVFRSYARYTGRHHGGKLELGGPIVGAVLVVCGGFWLPKPTPDSFNVTVFVHGEAGEHDLILRNTGTVWMTLGADRRQERLGDKGQADFKGIPGKFRGQPVSVSVEADGFEAVPSNGQHPLTGDTLELTVRRLPLTFSGSVLAAGRSVTNATVRIADTSAPVNAEGRFKLILPAPTTISSLTLEVNAPGFQMWREQVTPGGNDITVLLRPLP